jgi:flagellar hook-associated protein 3 FlgL
MSNGLRVTQRSVANTMLTGLQANLTRMQNIQEQLSSGRQLNRPSDSPVKTVEAMQFRSELRRAEQYVRNADDGLALLGAADTALMSSVDMTRRVRDLTLQGMNGSTNAQGREAIAAEIDTIRDGLLGIANARYLDRPIFGGNTTGSVAYTLPTTAPLVAEGGAYLGDSGKVTRTVAADTQVEVNVTGPEVFGDGSPESPQLFQVLKGISDALRSPEGPAMKTALDDGLGALDKATDRILTTLGKVGSLFNRVDTMKNRAEDQLVSLTNSLSEVENIDLPKTIVELQMQEVAYKAALGATARVVQPSLLDFLR